MMILWPGRFELDCCMHAPALLVLSVEVKGMTRLKVNTAEERTQERCGGSGLPDLVSQAPVLGVA